MAIVRSAGLVMYRFGPRGPEVLLGHPGGPFFRGKDEGAWTVPKGLLEEGEAPLAAARREFLEETSMPEHAIPSASESFLGLGEVRMSSGKRVLAWAFAGNCDPEALSSNLFELEWPPRSGQVARFPELDRYGFFDLATAHRKLSKPQASFVERLGEELLRAGSGNAV